LARARHLSHSIDCKYLIGTTFQHLRQKLDIEEILPAVYAELKQPIDCLETKKNEAAKSVAE
jgi:hypothetical protein